MLPEQAYIDFQKIYEKNFQRKITYEKAKEMATDFFGLLSAIYRGLERRYPDKK